MKNLKLFAISSALLLGLTACAASVEEAAADKATVENVTGKVLAPMSTVKPGANVSLNTTLPKSMVPGAFQTVKLQLIEGYTEGNLNVSIEPSDGLRLFGAAGSKTFDMGRTNSHDWDVDVKAETDGVYFLNVFAEAMGQPRSFSVRVNIGQVTQKMFDDAMPADGELVDGGKIRVLEADETIK